MVEPFRVPLENRSSFILGRKGSGKSTVIAGHRGRSFLRSRITIREPLYNGDYVIAVKVWSHFHELVKEVYRLVGGSSFLVTEGLIPAEILQEKWESVIWEEILEEYWDRFTQNPIDFRKLPHGEITANILSDYFNPRYSVVGSADEAAVRLFSEATQAVIQFIKESHRGCIILFDNMDEYPVRNPLFKAVVSGFLRSVNTMPRKFPGIKIVFCFPEEVANFITSSSSTLLKDFSNQYRLRWRPIDLLRVAAHRYRHFLREADNEFWERVKGINFQRDDGRTDRRKVVAFFNDLLEVTCRNGSNKTERTLPYIMRHTQLLPRHVLYIFNEIGKLSKTRTGGWRFFPSEEIVKAVGIAERLIAEDILHQYQPLYPIFISELRRVLPELSPIFNLSELDTVCNRFSSEVEVSSVQIPTMLYHMGIIGKLEDASAAIFNSSDVSKYSSLETASYLRASFHFCGVTDVSFNSSGTYCFHPVFSRYLDVTSWQSANRLFIYPARVDSFGDADDDEFD